jgi:hypothetical protein
MAVGTDIRFGAASLGELLGKIRRIRERVVEIRVVDDENPEYGEAIVEVGPRHNRRAKREDQAYLGGRALTASERRTYDHLVARLDDLDQRRAALLGGDHDA